MPPTRGTPPEGIIGYTAGLIDGEGSVYFSGNRYHTCVTQSETNNGGDLCRWLQTQWRIGIIFKQSRRWNGYENDCWFWQISAAFDVQHVLVTCLPYLRVKRDKAERALDDLARRFAENDVRYRWTPEQDDVLIAENGRLGTNAIAERTGRSPAAVSHRRRALGLPANPPGRPRRRPPSVL